jgi:hypothetical protein
MHVAAPLILFLSLGCTAGDIGDTADGPDAAVEDDGDDNDGDDFDDVTNDADGDGVADSQDNCPELANDDQLDTDSDSIGDACDCDPNDAAVAATLVVVDSLDADRALVSGAEGFATTSWGHTSGRLAQTRLVDDATDAVFFNLPATLADVRVELTAASTEIADFGADDLRQLFIVARASSTADDFAAEACGIEVVEGLSPTQKTSVLSLGGSPAAVDSTVRQRTDRALVTENEDFSVVLDIRNNTVTCSVTLGGNDTTTATGTTSLPAGAVGLFTRETRASFSNLKICRY